MTGHYLQKRQIDRFSRDRYDSAHYKHILKKNGVKVISAKEHISESPEGIILEAMLEGYAEFYSAELSEKIHRGQKENALKEKNNGGGVPLGYLLHPSNIQRDIVANHSVNHDKRHNYSKNKVLQLGLGHKKTLLLFVITVLFVITEGVCVSNKTSILLMIFKCILMSVPLFCK